MASQPASRPKLVSRMRTRRLHEASQFFIRHAHRQTHRQTLVRRSRKRCLLFHRLPHAAVLVLLAAATRTGVIAADPFGAVADRLGFLVRLLAAGDGGFLLGSNAGLG